MGLSAVADRIADVLAPGIRARMSQPRFVTLTAVGAMAYQALHDLTADEGKTTVDLAFEWLVVEALARYPGEGRTRGLPGSWKAERAKAAGERLSRRTYLNGPRVFGFTGVYRPFSRDVQVLTMDDRPGVNAWKLIDAWERDMSLSGYSSGNVGSRGGRLRADIADACRRSLEKGECAAPPSGHLLQCLAECLGPKEARAKERQALRRFITGGEHEIRNEITAKLLASPPPEDITQRSLAAHLLPGSSLPTRRALEAAIAYEEAATAIDNTWRRFLTYSTQQQGAVVSAAEALKTPGLAALAPRIGELAERAIESVAKLDDHGLNHDAFRALRSFTHRFTPAQLFETLTMRHEEVQAAKNKLPWIENVAGEWMVRTPYRSSDGLLDDTAWVHPMRLNTLMQFLATTE